MKITAVKPLKHYRLKLEFDNGITKIVSLKKFLTEATNPMTKQFLDAELFKKVSVLNGNLTWLDGEMDLSAESLFNWND